MAFHLGLDLGIASIGWSLAEYDEVGNFMRFVKTGVRIVPLNADHRKEFEGGKAITKNAVRRGKRGTRRLRQRFQLRRDNLLKAISATGTAPEVMLLPDARGAMDYYGIRACGLTEKIELNDFWQIIYRMNKRRGYKSNRKEEADNKKDAQIEETVITERKPTGFKHRKFGEEYELVLVEGIVGTTYDKSLITFPLGEKTEIQIKKQKSKDGTTFYFSKPDPKNWQARVDLMQYELEKTGLTPGAYFHRRVSEDKNYRIRERLVLRSAYRDEFDKLWKKQSEFHPELTDPALYRKALATVLPKNSPYKAYWQKQNLQTFVRDYILFFQRPLKTKRSSIGDCPLEFCKLTDADGKKKKKARKVIPASHPAYQEYRIWAAINNIRIEDDAGNTDILTPQQKEILFDKLQNTAKLTEKNVRKLLPGINKGLSIKMQDDLPGNATRIKINAAAKKVGVDLQSLCPTRADLQTLWHLLYSVGESKDVKRALQKKYNLTGEQAIALNKVTFGTDRGPYSAAAIKKLLPLMRAGRHFHTADISKYAYRRIVDKNNREAQVHSITEAYRGSLDKPADFQGLPVYLALTMQYGKYQAVEEVKKYEKPADIKLIDRHSIRNPLVEQILNEMLQTVREIWTEYGRPDKIRVELARDLKKSAKERQNTTTAVKKNQKSREAAAAKIREEFPHITNPTRSDILRYQLFTTQGTVCPYSGATIQKSDLFAKGVIDVDHIIPRQRYYDDSRSNKVVCFSKENRDKDNKTAYEYMKSKGETAFGAFVTRINDMTNLSRRTKFLLLTDEIPQDFNARNLQDTRYISRKAVELLHPVATQTVAVTSGSVTDHLRNIWRLNDAFKEVLIPRWEALDELYIRILEENADKKKRKKKDDEEADDLRARLMVPAVQYRTVKGHQRIDLRDWNKRLDHRHHALDAMVTVLTTQSIIKRLADLNKFYKAQKHLDEKKKAQWFPLPAADIAEQVKQQLRDILVSHKSTNRLTAKNTNRTRLRNPETGRLTTEEQRPKPTTARGMLHKETVFGKIKVIEEKKTPIAKALINVELVVNPELKNKLTEIMTQFSGNINDVKKHLKKNPLRDKDGNKIIALYLFSEKYAVNRDLASDITSSKMVEEIPDAALRKELENHIEETPGKLKDALAAEALEEFNRQRTDGSEATLPVYSVRVAKNSAEMRQLPGEHENQYVTLGNNFAALIYEDTETGKRDLEKLSFFDAVRIKATHGKLILPMRPGKKLYVVKKGDTVYMPEPGEVFDANSLDKDSRLLNRQLFRVTKITDEYIYCLPILFAAAMYREMKSDNYKNGSPATTEAEPRAFKNHLIPCKIDRLGRIRQP